MDLTIGAVDQSSTVTQSFSVRAMAPCGRVVRAARDDWKSACFWCHAIERRPVDLGTSTISARTESVAKSLSGR